MRSRSLHRQSLTIGELRVRIERRAARAALSTVPTVPSVPTESLRASVRTAVWTER
ncbi:MAG: hypothetical protein M3461_18140 [Pseudomonadota bacterium]|nr:hypothetical protein [Pseudomonadota bacterium]